MHITRLTAASVMSGQQDWEFYRADKCLHKRGHTQEAEGVTFPIEMMHII